MRQDYESIDGVLNSSKTIDRNFDYPELDPRNLVVLKKVVNKTGAVLVLTSSWKDDWIKDDEIFPDFQSYGILEKLVKTSYMEGLTNSLEDEAIAKLKT